MKTMRGKKRINPSIEAIWFATRNEATAEELMAALRWGECVRKRDSQIHSNTVESVCSLLKRGVYGTYHSIGKRHLSRYPGEFEFSWNTRAMDDGERTFLAVKQAEGKCQFAERRADRP